MSLLGVALGSNGLGCAPGAFFFADELAPDWDLPQRMSGITTRQFQKVTAVAVEPLRLTCACSGADSAAAAAAAVAVASASFVASTSLSAASAASSIHQFLGRIR